MTLVNRNLSRQVALFLIVISCLAVSVMTLLVRFLPTTAVSQVWNLSSGGAIGIGLASLTLGAILLGDRLGRIVLPSLLSVFALFSVFYQTTRPAGAESLPGEALLIPLAPSLFLLLMAGCCWLGTEKDWTRTLWRFSGSLGIAFGVVVLLATLGPWSGGALALLATQASPAGAVVALALGVAFWLVTGDRSGDPARLSRSVMLIGVAGVVATFYLAYEATHATESARKLQAGELLDNLALTVEQSTLNRARLLERMADRWYRLDGVIDTAYRNRAARVLFDDRPSITGLMLIDKRARENWRLATDPSLTLWLESQLTTPEGLRWMRLFPEKGTSRSWLVPDEQHPERALILTRPSDTSDLYLVAILDLDQLIQKEVPRDPGQLVVNFTNDKGDLEPLVSDRSRAGETELATRTVQLGGGDESLNLTATSESGNVGFLSAGILLFGLILTYNVMRSRALVLIQAEQARRLAVEEQRFRSLFDHHPDAVFVIGEDGRYEKINPVTADILAMPGNQLIGVDFREVINGDTVPPEDLQRLHLAYDQAARGYARPGFTMAFQAFGEAPRYFDALFVPILVDGRVSGVFGIARDITARLRAEERQRLMERSLEASSNAVLITDARRDGYPVAYVNPAFSQISGYSAAEVEGQTLDYMVGSGTDPKDIEAIRAAVSGARPESLTIRSYRKDGTQFWNQLFISPVRDTTGTLTHFIAIMNDISEKKEQDQQLAYQATHDVLTGLGNRSLFHDRLYHDFELARRHDRMLAILFIDLDEFKPINDTLGHKVGDRLLISVSERLNRVVRPSDTLVRFGGDEFVLLLPDLDRPAEAQEVAERLLYQLDRPHRVENHELHISASIGIATISDEVEEPEKLLQRADMAMYKAKQQGRNTYEVFSGDLDKKLSRRVALRNDLQEAIDKQQLYLVYQPVIDREGQVEGVEALLRWHHPDKGHIPPSEFIPVAEETGQIVPLGQWVLGQACDDALELLDMGLLGGSMAVNLSPLQFHRPNFLPSLRKLLEKCRLPPEYLELELTEGILMRDSEGAIDTLNALNGLGVRTAIDDFGTGYSSFSYLRQLPVDKIKIDRSFVMDVTSSEKDSAVCKGIITLARELDLKVVAEGVETEAQFRHLRSLECEVFQGYWFARPMRKEALVVWLRDRLS